MYWSTPLQSGADSVAPKTLASAMSSRISEAPTLAASLNIAFFALNGWSMNSIEGTPIGLRARLEPLAQTGRASATASAPKHAMREHAAQRAAGFLTDMEALLGRRSQRLWGVPLTCRCRNTVARAGPGNIGHVAYFAAATCG